jgi:hypothetical protein
MSAQQQAIIISAFACCGKSYAAKYANQMKIPYTVVDLDSENYSHHKNGKKNENFIKDYMKAIKHYATQKVILLVSAHEAVHKALAHERLWHAIVYPRMLLKAEWLKRMKDRGSPESLVQIFDKNWDEFVAECERQRAGVHAPLAAGKYLSDVLAPIITKFERARKNHLLDAPADVQARTGQR